MTGNISSTKRKQKRKSNNGSNCNKTRIIFRGTKQSERLQDLFRGMGKAARKVTATVRKKLLKNSGRSGGGN